MAGAYNTAAYGGSFLSGVVFGYVAKIFDSYDLPLILTAFVLGFGALMWLKTRRKSLFQKVSPNTRKLSGSPETESKFPREVRFGKLEVPFGAYRGLRADDGARIADNPSAI